MTLTILSVATVVFVGGFLLYFKAVASERGQLIAALTFAYALGTSWQFALGFREAGMVTGLGFHAGALAVLWGLRHFLKERV